MPNLTSDTLSQRELARRLLIDLFSERRRISVEQAVNASAELGVSRATLIRARGDLGLRTIRNGPLPAFWEAPEGADEGPASPQTTGAVTEEVTLDDSRS
jgi:hypothetical protein